MRQPRFMAASTDEETLAAAGDLANDTFIVYFDVEMD